MAKDDDHTRNSLKASAYAEAAVDRFDQPADFPDVDPTDTTSILHGTSAIIGRGAWSAGRMVVASDAIAAYEHAKQVRREREAEEARELAHLAEWNTHMTEVGGVRMTNAEAQDARRRVLAHADEYADRENLSENERAEFRRWVARKIELEDKRGRGTITAAEEREEAEGDRSRVGHVTDNATAEAHQRRGRDVDAKAQRSDANVLLRQDRAAPAPTEDVFRDYVGATATQPVASTELAVEVKRTGLGL